MSSYFQTLASKKFYDDFIYFRLLACGSRQFLIAFGLITFPFKITLTYTEEGVHSVTNYSLIGDGLWQMYQVNFVFLLWMNTKYYSNNSCSYIFRVQDWDWREVLTKINDECHLPTPTLMRCRGNVIKKNMENIFVDYCLSIHRKCY